MSNKQHIINHIKYQLMNESTGNIVESDDDFVDHIHIFQHPWEDKAGNHPDDVVKDHDVQAKRFSESSKRLKKEGHGHLATTHQVASEVHALAHKHKDSKHSKFLHDMAQVAREHAHQTHTMHDNNKGHTFGKERDPYLDSDWRESPQDLSHSANIAKHLHKFVKNHIKENINESEEYDGHMPDTHTVDYKSHYDYKKGRESTKADPAEHHKEQAAKHRAVIDNDYMDIKHNLDTHQIVASMHDSAALFHKNKHKDADHISHLAHLGSSIAHKSHYDETMGELDNLKALQKGVKHIANYVTSKRQNQKF